MAAFADGRQATDGVRLAGAATEAGKPDCPIRDRLVRSLMIGFVGSSDSMDVPQPSPRPRRATCVPSRLDLGIGLAVAVLVSLGTGLAATSQDQVRPLDAGAIVLVTLAALGLGWRRCAPVVALSVVVTLVSGYLLLGYPYGPIQLCMVFAMFELARRRGLRTSLLACAAAVTAIAAATLFRALAQAETPVLLLAVWASWLVIPWAVGALVQVRSAATRRARQELAARAALEERLRVAREVHDVAGHGFAAVAMQAGVALLVFHEQPKQVKESLEAIQLTSAKALSDLRLMLDAFHRQTVADSGRAESVATDGLRDVAALVDNVRAAGLPVRLSLEDVAAPPAIDHAAYRVVQEALTNVLRHAGPTTAEVRVQRERDSLIVEVVDDGVGTDEVRPGRGLTGMRDRVVVAMGGELITQPRPGGGFRIWARLPIAGDAT
jgi:signal transduction histidine kinase